ncbi:haloacid dehalogenase type II [Luteolibacter sp. AS25]|uniref:haloacid dehalogenase type II n=1 Tax=Luteolibacter sp. AS25 TaxID=3135776 RepID=UPI00398ADC35
MPITKLLLATALLLSPTIARADDEMATEVTRPKVIFFDVNETLLDLGQMRESVGKALDGREELLPLWFSTMLHYSLVDTVTGRYHGFADIGVAALMMTAETNGIELTEEAAREAIVTPLRSLPPHPDVKEGLQSLKDQGFRLISFTNSSNKGVKTQFENAGLIEFFEARLSVEDEKVYKPALASYEWALKQANVKPEEAMMVAAHGWDIAGVKAAGMTGVFVTRPGKALYPLAIPADKKVATITELAEWTKTLK